MNALKEKLSSLSEKAKQKIKTGSVKKLLASRAFVVTCCVALIVAAIGVSALLGKATVDPVETGSEAGKTLGNPVLVDGQTEQPETSDSPAGTESEPASDLMTMTVRNRKDVRDEAMAVLKQIADNPDAMPDDKENALASIAAIVADMEAEANIETLALAKGIPQVVAVISGGQCSLIVDSETLSSAEITQLQELVYDQSGILPANTKIILDNSTAS